MPSINILIVKDTFCLYKCLCLQRGNTYSNDKQEYIWKRKEAMVDNNMKQQPHKPNGCKTHATTQHGNPACDTCNDTQT